MTYFPALTEAEMVTLYKLTNRVITNLTVVDRARTERGRDAQFTARIEYHKALAEKLRT